MANKKLLKKLEELKKSLEVIKMEKIDPPERRFLTTECYRCTLNNGKVITRESILKNKSSGSAVVILPLTKNLETILVVQPRVFTSSGIGIELPSGYIDSGEEPIDAARRELREETGYEADNLIKLAEYYQDQGCSRAYNYCFLAENCVKRYEQDLDYDEFIHYLPCSFSDVCDLVDENIINDAGSLLAIEKAKKFILR